MKPQRHKTPKNVHPQKKAPSLLKQLRNSQKVNKYVSLLAIFLLLLNLVVPVLSIPQAFGLGEDTSYVAADFVYDDTENKIVAGFSETGESKYADSADKAIVFPTGITTIKASAFPSKGIKAVTLPETVTTVGNYAFDQNIIESLTFTETGQLTTIGEGAFRSSRLTSLILPVSLTSIGEAAFANNGLTSVSGPSDQALSNLTTIGGSAFANNKLTTFSVGDKLTAIGSNAFSGNGITVKVLATNAPAIANDYGVGNGFVINPVPITVAYQDKADNSTLKTSLTIGDDFHNGTAFFSRGREFEQADGQKLAQDISNYLYQGIKEALPFTLTATNNHVTLHYVKDTEKPIITVGDIAFMQGSGIKTASDLLSKASAVDSLGTAITGDKLTVTGLPEGGIDTTNQGSYEVAFRAEDTRGNYATKKVTVTVQESLLYTSIGNGWVYGDFTYSGSTLTGLSDSGKAKAPDRILTLPEINPTTLDPITAVGNGAFSMPETLTSTGIDFSRMLDLQVINYFAFADVGRDSAPSSSDLDLRPLVNLKELKAYAFADVAVIKDIKANGLPNLESVEEHLVTRNDVTPVNVDFSNNPKLTHIGYDSLIAKGIIKVTDNPVLTTIGYNSQYSSPTVIDLHNNPLLSEIPNNFAGGSAESSQNLTKIDLSGCSAITVIGYNAFGFAGGDTYTILNELNLTGLTSLTTIGDYAFANILGNAAITELDFQQMPNLTVIGAGAFIGADYIEKLDFSNLTKLTTIAYNAFTARGTLTATKTIDFTGCSSLTSIGATAFYKTGVKAINLVDLPVLREIGAQSDYSGVFGNATNLETVNISNCPELKRIGDAVFRESSNISALTLDNLPQLTHIGNSAFGGLTKLKALDLSNLHNLKMIGNSAFYNSPLETLNLSGLSKLVVIGNYAFHQSPLTSLDLTSLSALEEIGQYAFGKATLTELDLTNNLALKKIDAWAFDISPITSLDFSQNTELTYLAGFNDFKGTSLDLSHNTKLTEIGYGAFYNAKLTSLNLGEGSLITVLGHFSFINSELTNEQLIWRDASSLEEIGTAAFNSAKFTVFPINNPVALKRIGQSSFYASEFSELDLSMSDIEAISEYAFANSPLKLITIKSINNVVDVDETKKTLYQYYDLDYVNSHDFYFSTINRNIPIKVLGANNANDAIGYHFVDGEVNIAYKAKIGGSELLPPGTQWVKKGEVITPPQVFGYAYDAPTLTKVEHDEAGETKTGPVTITDDLLAVYANPDTPLTFKYIKRAADFADDYQNNRLFFTGKTTSASVGDELSLKLSYLINMANAANDIKQGFTGSVEIHYDPTMINPDSIRVTHQNDRYDIDLTTDGIIRLKFTSDFNETVHGGGGAGDSITPTITFKLLQNGDVPHNKPTELTAFILDKGEMVNQSDPITVKGQLPTPSFYKSDGTSHHEIEVGESISLLPTIEGHTEYQFTTTPEVTYSFEYRDLKRKIASYVLQDTLPDYKRYARDAEGNFRYDGDGKVIIETAKAQISAASQASGWEYADGDATAKMTQTIAGTLMPTLPTLTLAFKDMVPEGNSARREQRIHNLASIVATPDNPWMSEAETPVQLEPNYSNGASEDTRLYNYITGEGGDVRNPEITASFSGTGWGTKYSSQQDNRFYNLSSEKHQAFPWLIESTLHYSSGQMKDFSLTHYGLDERLKYTGIKIEEGFKAATTVVIAYDATGQEVCRSEGQGDVTFSTADQDRIAYVVISDASIKLTETDVKNKRNKLARAIVYTALRNPDHAENDYDSIKASDETKLNYLAKMGEAFEFGGPDNWQSYNQDFKNTADMTGYRQDQFRLYNVAPGLGLRKELVTGGHEIISGDSVHYYEGETAYYDLYLDAYNLIDESGVPVQLTGYYAKERRFFDNIILKNVVIYEKLSPKLNFTDFTPSEALVAGTTNLNWTPELDTDGHLILKITADTLNTGTVTTLGTVSSTVDVSALSDEVLDNEVFMRSEAVVQKMPNGTTAPMSDVTNHTPVSTGVETPFDEEADPDKTFYSKRSLIVAATSAYQISKFIRGDMSGSDPAAPEKIGGWQRGMLGTYPGKSIEYRLAFADTRTDVAGPIPEHGLPTVIDVLPENNDLRITNTTSPTHNSRGSEFTNTFESATISGETADITATLLANYNISYLVMSGSNKIDYGTKTADVYFNDQTWTPAAGFTLGANQRVVAVKFEPINSGAISTTGMNFNFIIKTKAPTDPSDIGKVAVNTFVYKDALQATFSESNKVENIIKDYTAKISFKKVRADDGTTPIAGVTFGLYNTSGKLIQTAVSGNDGMVTFKDFEPNDYTVSELSTPADFKLDTKARKLHKSHFYLSDSSYVYSWGSNSDWNYTALWENAEVDRYGAIQLVKQDGEGNGLGGVEFDIQGTTGYHTTVTTGSDGKTSQLGSLATGTYTVTEKKGYGSLEVLSAPFQIKIAKGDNIGETAVSLLGTPDDVTAVSETNKITVTVVNNKAKISLFKGGTHNDAHILPTPKANWELNQFDLEQGGLGGVTFNLYDTSIESAFPTVLTTGTGLPGTAKGVATLSGLKVNTLYYVTETNTPEHYLANDKKVYFFVNEKGNVYYVEDGLAAQVMVKEKNLLDETQQGCYLNKSNNQLLIANFPVTQTAKFEIEKVDKQDKAIKLAGATFKLKKRNGSDWETEAPTVVATPVTNAEGKLTLPTLAAGHYRLTETKAPDNYLTGDDFYVWNDKKSDWQAETALTFEVKKYTPKQSVSYQIANQSLLPTVVKGDYIATYDTNSTAQKNALKAVMDTYGDSLKLQQIKDVNNPGVVIVLSGLTGAEFKLEAYEGDITAANLKDSWTITSGASGAFDLSSALSPTTGAKVTFKEDYTYVFTETKAPTGYKLNATPVIYQPRLPVEKAGIIRDGGRWIGLQNDVEKHSLRIQTDEGLMGNKARVLGGVTFELLYSDGTPVLASDGKAARQTTNAQGLLTWDNLVSGDYYLRELSSEVDKNLLDPTKGKSDATFPTEFRPSKNDYHIVFTGASDIVLEGKGTALKDSAHFDDDKYREGGAAYQTSAGDVFITLYYDRTTQLILNKVDQNGDPVAGATFELTRPSDDPYTGSNTYTTDQDGQLTILGLGDGNGNKDIYTLTETQAPEGYSLSANPDDNIWYFRVVKDSEGLLQVIEVKADGTKKADLASLGVLKESEHDIIPDKTKNLTGYQSQTFSHQVLNQKFDPALPLTGGKGFNAVMRLVMTAFGLALVGYVYQQRKRKIGNL